MVLSIKICYVENQLIYAQAEANKEIYAIRLRVGVPKCDLLNLYFTLLLFSFFVCFGLHPLFFYFSFFNIRIRCCLKIKKIFQLLILINTTNSIN